MAQEAPKTPQEAPKTAQDEPTRAPRSPERPQEAPRGSQERPKSGSDLFFPAPRASKSAPRGLQEGFRGLQRRRCDSDPILDPLWAPKKDAWTAKIKQIQCSVRELRDFSSFSSDRSCAPIWDPPGLLLGLLGSSWVVLGPSRGPLGCSWDPLGLLSSGSTDHETGSVVGFVAPAPLR